MYLKMKKTGNHYTYFIKGTIFDTPFSSSPEKPVNIGATPLTN